MLNIILGTIVLTFNILFVNSAIDKTSTIWEDDINNPINEEYVVEVAFNLEIDIESVTQEQFNDRYIND